MAKEINEKTFELNITNELLNLSKSFIWYLDHNVGNLIPSSSFVPVLEIDNQASNQTPPIIINGGVSHKYRTSFDGLTSEVNFFFFFFFYDNKIISELLSELICIQIERFANILLKQDKPDLEIFLDIVLESLNRFADYELKQFPSSNLLIENVKLYIQRIEENFNSNRIIQNAPSRFTNIIPKEGLKFKFENKYDFSAINYQVF